MQDVRASSIGMLNYLRGHASHTDLKDLKGKDWLLYDSINRVGAALDAGIGRVCAPVASGPTEESDVPIRSVSVLVAPSLTEDRNLPSWWSLSWRWRVRGPTWWRPIWRAEMRWGMLRLEWWRPIRWRKLQ